MDRKERASEVFATRETELQDLSQWMYDNPEIAYEELETSRRYVEMLSSGGFTVEYPAYGLDTAFAARVGSSGPEVIICAEMDALPEVGHACAHNIIGTAAIGAGLALAPLVEELGIRVTVLGTPAEEAYGGKVDLINAGAFAGGAAAMMVHPAIKDVVDPEFLAVSHIDVEFTGKAAHASGGPHLGINALDAAVQAYSNVSMLRQQLMDTDRVHGVITHGGTAPNVIPDNTAMSWYVRAPTDERLDEVYAKVIRCFEAAALATGCGYEVTDRGHRYKEMLTSRVMAEIYKENSDRLGRTMHYLADLPQEMFGSTDMANVSHELPAIHPVLDLHCFPVINHQREFAAHTTTDDGKQAIRDGALAMAGTVIDLAEGDRWDSL